MTQVLERPDQAWSPEAYADMSINMTSVGPWITRSAIGDRLGRYQATKIASRLIYRPLFVVYAAS